MTRAPEVEQTIVIRPLAEQDVEEAWHCAHTSLARAAEVYEPPGLPGAGDPPTPQQISDGLARIRHLHRLDPDGAWVAVRPGNGQEMADKIIGVGLACVRGGLWFLSLLAVDTAHQAIGVGRRLLDATLRYAEDVPSAWILASSDPKALRRYQSAGFDLHPGYAAVGHLDRAAIPSGLDVRAGDWDRDGELVDDVITGLRGVPYGLDLELFKVNNRPLLVVDGLGYAIVKPSGVVSLGARSPETARRLLWAALAAADEPISLDWLVAGQQWAIDVALRGRLSLYAGPSSCLRNVTAPMTPFIPSGALG